MNTSAICAQGLGRWFEKKHAVADLTLEVPRGSIFGFLGQNGAGKTTTIRMAAGHLHPDEGSIQVLEQDPRTMPREICQRVAYVSEAMNVPRWMRMRDGLALNAALYPKWDAARARDLVRRFEVDEKAAYGTMSKGQRRAFCLILALSAGAELLILDEPASGLDTAARRVFLDALLEANRERECTVFLSSHMLTDLERVVDRVAILKSGKLILEGELEAFKEGARVLYLPGTASLATLERHFRVESYRKVADEVRVTLLDYNEERYRALCSEDAAFASGQAHGVNLEDLFVALVTGETVEREGSVL